MVGDSGNDDDSIIVMHPDKLTELKIGKGDPVILKGKKNSQTICLVWADYKMNKENILTNKVIRNNLNIKTGGKKSYNYPFPYMFYRYPYC